jgi:hypothetical protein
LLNGRQVSSASTRIASQALTVPTVMQASLPPASTTVAAPLRRQHQRLGESVVGRRAGAGHREDRPAQSEFERYLRCRRVRHHAHDGHGCTRGLPSL